jgi:hypothetical protein
MLKSEDMGRANNAISTNNFRYKRLYEIIWSYSIPRLNLEMPSGVYQLPNLPTICPKKTGNKISPGFQEANVGYEQWIKENIRNVLSIVSSAILHS